MKPESPHDELLHEIIADSAAGLSADGVLQLVRTEKLRRARRQKLAATVSLAAVTILSVTLLLTRAPAPAPSAAVPPVPAKAAAEPYAINRLSDDELLALLKAQGEPAALINLPDGGRELLVAVTDREPDTTSPQ